MKTILLSLLCLCGIVSITAQVRRTQPPKSGPAPVIKLDEHQKFELNNGLQVLVMENHQLPRVSVHLSLDKAPVLEGDKAGVSSLMAALMGNGTTNIPKDEFNEEVDFMGARINFGSGSAYAQSLTKYFPRVMEMLADATINPNFTQEEFDKQKDILITGIKSQENDVAGIAERVSDALSYGKAHPYGEFVTEATANNVSLADVTKFYRDNFVPANAYMVIVGDITFEKAKELVETHFVGWTKAVPLSFQYTQPVNPQYSRINFVDMPNAVQSEIYVQSLTDFEMKDPDYIASKLANFILGGGGQRLYLNLREDKGYTYGSYSGLSDDKYAPGRFQATASVLNMVTDSSVVEILKELERIANEPVTEDELARAKAKYAGNFVMALEKPETVAQYALNVETENLPADFYQKYLERVNAVTVTDVQQAIQKHINLNKLRVVVVGKGAEVLTNLEKVAYKGKTMPIEFFDKEANKVQRPSYDVEIPEGLTGQAVLNKYIEAIGGADKLKEVKSLFTKATGSMAGQNLDLIVKATNIGQRAMEIQMMGTTVNKQVVNKDSGYMEMQGQRMDLEGEMLKAAKLEAILFPELQYVKAQVEISGVENINGKKAYRIALSSGKTAFYDAETGVKVQEVTDLEMNGQSVSTTISLGDYKEVSGILFPHTLSQTVGPDKIDFVIQSIVVNEGVSEADFE